MSAWRGFNVGVAAFPCAKDIVVIIFTAIVRVYSRMVLSLGPHTLTPAQ
jgi:hypothetical protein